MPKDLLTLSLNRKLAEAEASGDTERAKLLKAKIAAQAKEWAKVEADAAETLEAPEAPVAAPVKKAAAKKSAKK